MYNLKVLGENAVNLYFSVKPHSEYLKTVDWLSSISLDIPNATLEGAKY
jgi:hypothetical protein